MALRITFDIAIARSGFCWKTQDESHAWVRRGSHEKSCCWLQHTANSARIWRLEPFIYLFIYLFILHMWCTSFCRIHCHSILRCCAATGEIGLPETAGFLLVLGVCEDDFGLQIASARRSLNRTGPAVPCFGFRVRALWDFSPRKSASGKSVGTGPSARFHGTNQVWERKTHRGQHFTMNNPPCRN